LWSEGADWASNSAPGPSAAGLFNDALAGNLSNTLDVTFVINSLTLGAAQTTPVTINTTTTDNSLFSTVNWQPSNPHPCL